MKGPWVCGNRKGANVTEHTRLDVYMPIYTVGEAVAYVVSTSSTGKRTLCDLEFIKYSLVRALVNFKMFGRLGVRLLK